MHAVLRLLTGHDLHFVESGIMGSTGCTDITRVEDGDEKICYNK